MIFVNYKTYQQGSGHNAVNLTKILEEVLNETGVKIIPVAQIIDAEMVVDSTKLDVWVQHIDPISYGAHTGWVLPEEAVRVGLKGVFLNHSEHKYNDWDALVKSVARCKEVNLKTLVFASDLEEFKRVVEELKPDYAAYEPPEFIGSTTTSVAEAKPEIIGKAFEISKQHNIPLIVGAGINKKADVQKSLEMGAVGVATATDIVKASNPKAEALDLAEGFLK